MAGRFKANANEADATNHRVYEKYTLERSRRIGRKRRVEDVGETQRRRVECLDGSVNRMFDWQPNRPGFESQQL